MSHPRIPRKLNYALIQQYVAKQHPERTLVQVKDSNRREQWVLRFEMKEGQLEAQRYVPSEVDPGLLRKTLDYSPVALQMLFQQLLDVEGSPYEITGITTESSVY